MKVALYHPWIYTKGGAEKVVMKLIQEGDFDYDIFTHYYRQDETFSWFKEQDITNLAPDAQMGGVFSRGITFGLRHFLTEKLDLSDYDALLVSTAGLAELINYRNHEIPVFAYCHTPLRYVHDESIKERIREYRGIPTRILNKVLGTGYKVLEQYAWNQFDHVMCNSENTKQRVLEGNLVEKDKLSVINPGADMSRFQPTGKFKPIFFVPGRINKYKRQDKAIEIFKKFIDKNELDREFKLVIAGFCEDKYKDYYYELCDMAEGYNIEVLKNPPDKKYFDLYRNCYAVLFTAVNEDWGLVPIEANACGKMCISVNEGGPKESINDGENGFLCDDDEEFVEKMRFLARNPNLLYDKEKDCREEAEKYAWDKFADKVENTISAVIRDGEIRKWEPYEARR